jgi:hypothetical protein
MKLFLRKIKIKLNLVFVVWGGVNNRNDETRFRVISFDNIGSTNIQNLHQQKCGKFFSTM